MKGYIENSADSKAGASECIPLVEVLHLAGVNHRTAPLEIREKLSVPKARINEALQILSKKLGLSELVILSTCNRTEFYWASAFAEATADKSEKQIYPLDFFRALPLVDSEIIARLSPLVYTYHGKEVAHHLFEVTAGLDSMALGETQVSGQVRAAYECSREIGVTGIALNFLFQKAFETTKRIHTQTALFSQKASIPAVALEFARAVFEELSDVFVLVIGTGEIAEVTVEVLRKRGVRKMAFITRTQERARAWQENYPGCEVATLENLSSLLWKADIVVACTITDQPILSAKEVSQALIAREKRNRPFLVLDLGIPRNVSPDLKKLEQVYLKDIDDLQEVVNKNKAQLEVEVEKAQQIIETGVREYLQFCLSATAASTIKELRAFAEDIARKELDRSIPKLGELSPEQRQELLTLVHRILAKILHHPSERLRFISRDRQGQQALQWARILFGLQPLDHQSHPSDSSDQSQSKNEKPE